MLDAAFLCKMRKELCPRDPGSTKKMSSLVTARKLQTATNIPTRQAYARRVRRERMPPTILAANSMGQLICPSKRKIASPSSSQASHKTT